MNFSLKYNKPKKIENRLYLFSKIKELANFNFSKKELDFVKEKIEKKASEPISLIQPNDNILFVNLTEVNDKNRRKGFCGWSKCKELQLDSITVYSSAKNEFTESFLEGFLLSSYTFEKYKSEKKEYLLNVNLHYADLKKEVIEDLEKIVLATSKAKDLVNEPHWYLNATTYAKEIKDLGKKAGFSVKVFDKKKIESLKMGGIMAVNKGSVQPPTFSILEWKPKKIKNKKPIVFVGKGIVYDTGGLSLKPTANSMDMMKCDMAGSAAIVGAIYAISMLKLPYHIIGLVPATDNRPGNDAVTPGDVITMYGGKTVEVLNTDAEGRLVLADALEYAKQYKPELVLDFATLTGAAARAIGPQGIVCMGTAKESVKEKLKESGKKVHERLVEFPFWEEYGELINSDIADIKNLGGPYAGAITAGKFLEHFIDYDWMHFDIAGPAYIKQPDSYKGKNGTGVGVRLLVDFIKNYA